jgi:phosphoribosylaminoimidazole carboxylase PurE protein
MGTASAQVLIIMGSKSDMAIMEKVGVQLGEFGIESTIEIASAHRNPARSAKLASEARSNGIKVVVAGAGLAAALPGVMAAHTSLPVIGVPLASGALNGVDSLLSIVQMPPGVPVATVGIGAHKNAAILAAQFIAQSDADVAQKLEEFRRKQSEA